MDDAEDGRCNEARTFENRGLRNKDVQAESARDVSVKPLPQLVVPISRDDYTNRRNRCNGVDQLEEEHDEFVGTGAAQK